MASQTHYTWIISSEKQDVAGVPAHVEGEAQGEYLTMLATGPTTVQDKLKAASVKSVLSYVEVPGGQGPRPGAGKPGLLVVVGLTPAPGQEQDLNDWYRDEHITMLSKVPGWIKSQRLKLVDDSQAGPQYLALHFYEKENGTGSSQEFKDAVMTPWCSKIISTCKNNGSNGYARWEWQL